MPALKDPQERYQELLKQSQKQLARRVFDLEGRLQRRVYDPFTGLLDKVHFRERLEEEVARASRLKHPVAVVLIDLDKFKRVNDIHGHEIGDQTLLKLVGLINKELVKVIQETKRDYDIPGNLDIAGRVGGEEFAVILPGTTIEGGDVFGERLRKRVDSARFEFEVDGQRINVDETQPGGRFTISVGISSYPAGMRDPKDLGAYDNEQANSDNRGIAERLMRTADAALYYAKKTRNTVCSRTYGDTKR